MSTPTQQWRGVAAEQTDDLPGKISSLRGSRRKAWTARMPPSDSVNWMTTRATVSRVLR